MAIVQPFQLVLLTGNGNISLHVTVLLLLVMLQVVLVTRFDTRLVLSGVGLVSFNDMLLLPVIVSERVYRLSLFLLLTFHGILVTRFDTRLL